MKWSLLLIGLCLLISLEFGLGYPLDDENKVKEGDDMAATEKRDKVAAEKKKDGAEKADGPKPKDAEHKAGEQRQVTTKAPVKATTKPTTPVVVTTAGPATTVPVTKPTEAPKPTTPEKVTVATTPAVTTPVVTTPAPGSTPTVAPSKMPPTKAPPVPEEEGDVENSANNTKNMNATTFHVALRFLEEKWSDDLLITVNPVFEKTKQMVLTSLEKLYQAEPSFKQVVLIGFSDSQGQKKAERRQVVKAAPPGVVADFYVRFHTFGMHLRKLADEIKDGKLDTHPVSKKFVRACGNDNIGYFSFQTPLNQKDVYALPTAESNATHTAIKDFSLTPVMYDILVTKRKYLALQLLNPPIFPKLLMVSEFQLIEDIPICTVSAAICRH
eukprot:Seg2300.2 transcript_id=Seg2300.2/GoldUCD/mRNA.D3Y31 product="hypothetical protein" protein_id=Seg2300.2/GoldUCD/D3Y31